MYTDKQRDRDIAENVTEAKVTMRVVQEMAESCSSWMKFTMDCEDANIDKKVPMLDIKVWREGNNKIKHEFYEKPMTSDFVMMKRSAMSQGTKITTLTQEVIRRERNTGRNTKLTDRVKELDKFMYKMKRSGYSEIERKEVLEAGLVGYYKKVKRELDGGERVNKDGSKDRSKRQTDKLKRLSNWFKPKEMEDKDNKRKRDYKDEMKIKTKDNKKSKTPVEAVVFIPITPKGILKARLQKWEDDFTQINKTPKVRFIERGGLNSKICCVEPIPGRIKIAKDQSAQYVKMGRGTRNKWANVKQRGSYTSLVVKTVEVYM